MGDEVRLSVARVKQLAPFMSAAAVAHALGVSARVVRRIGVTHGIRFSTRRYRRRTPEEAQAWLQTVAYLKHERSLLDDPPHLWLRDL